MSYCIPLVIQSAENGVTQIVLGRDAKAGERIGPLSRVSVLVDAYNHVQAEVVIHDVRFGKPTTAPTPRMHRAMDSLQEWASIGSRAASVVANLKQGTFAIRVANSDGRVIEFTVPSLESDEAVRHACALLELTEKKP